MAYIDELTADRIGEVLETGRITGMVGVPALWQLFHRKITQELAAQPRYVEEAMQRADGRQRGAAQRAGHQPRQAVVLAGAPQVRREDQAS